MSLTIYNQLFWLLVLLPVLFYIGKTLVNRGSLYRNTAALLRVLAIVFVILALCRPFYSTSTDNNHVVYLLDASASINLDSLKKSVRKMKRNISELSTGDSYSIFLFANGIKPLKADKVDEEISQIEESLSSAEFRSKSTIADTLNSIKMVYPADKSKVLCLFSDGVETESDLGFVVNQLKGEEVNFVFEELERFQKPEVSVVDLSASTAHAYKGETVRLTAKLLSNYDTKAKVRFLTRGIVVTEKELDLSENTEKELDYEFSLQTETSGVWTAEIVAEKDYFPSNNQSSCSVDMLGETRLLVLHNKPAKLREFKRALETQDVSVDVRGKFGVPGSFNELCEFDALMLADIDANSFTFRQMELVRKYVTEFGGGLIMTGSENSFGLGGYFKTPIEEVLPINSRYEKEKEHPSLAIVLVIDKSGSMSGAPIELAREAAKSSVEVLSARDQVGVIAFDGSAKIVAELTSAAGKNSVINQIETIGAGGGTNMYPAMAECRDMLATATAKIKHMIVLSDGQSSGGDFEGIAAELSGLGVTVSTVSLGSGAAVNLMAKIAEIGRGRAYVTNDASEMPRIFTKETVEASRSAIKEEPFLPVKVSTTNSLSGINLDNAPYLLGYVMTKAKPSVEMQLLTENGDPLLAVGRFGLGKSAAFTSDVTDQWAGEWLEWNNFGKFWAQTVRSVTRSSANQNMMITQKERGSIIDLSIVCRDNNGALENHIKWDTMLTNGTGLNQKLEMTQVGFGRYVTSFNKPDTKSYAVRINDLTNNRVKTLFDVRKYSREYLLSSKTDPVLETLPKFDANMNDSIRNKAIQNSALGIFAVLAMLAILGSTFFRRI